MIDENSRWPFSISAASDRGSVRERNEDYYGIFDPETEAQQESRGVLVVVTDGMGGHFSGEEASRMVVEVMGDIYYSDSEKKKDAKETLEIAFREANRRVFHHVGNGRKGTAGTTCTSVALFPDHYNIAHAGDSRAYLIRGGKIEQLTEDHSLVGEMVQRGLIDKEEAIRHPRRNVLTRAVGLRNEVAPDIHEEIPFKDGDKILLCSDGLFSMVPEDEIESIVEHHDPKDACRKLIEAAIKYGGDDNITAVVIQKRQ
ncbi:MAG: Stp1/IreP family PP2C-type Ser/Thr phosphatase [Candidatus Krumholzibacteria bacterium]|nr:Stp1/IreP family PP2C-type Ser/Thr phosphatase [Candidatus Krumholzibacteria bacterium]